MSDLSREIAAYEAEREELERAHLGEFAVFYNGTRFGVFTDFQAAADAAVGKFGRGPYLIREIGSPQFEVPSLFTFVPASTP